MIIKNLTRRSGSSQLLTYIFRYILNDEKQGADAPFVIRHNVMSKDIPGFIREFKENADRRIHMRKDQIAINHTILSWSNRDTSQITNEKIRDLANRYIELRGIGNIYVGALHTDRDHLHLHLAMSGNQISGLSSRISQRAFADLKVELDRYTRTEYSTE
jgi:hypothetical protein